jgi:endoglucanase
MLLRRLAEAPGVSGDEGEVRTILREEIEGRVEELFCDSMGNLYARKGKGKKPRVMLAAHMDEVGLIVTGFEKSGLLRVDIVGGIDNRVLIAKPVTVGKDRVPGVIGAKAIHLQKASERKKAIPLDNIFVDIGARNQDEAEKLAKVGDYIAFSAKTRDIGDNCLCGKAFDDRAGCAVLVDVLKDEYNVDLTAVFTVQEEVGLRGAGVAACTVQPDIALVVEGTTASDVTGTKSHGYVTKLGGGPAITLMDSSYIAPQPMIDLLVKTAEKLAIPCQFRHLTVAATDAGKISQSLEGIMTGVVSVPCRYIHSPASVISQEDWHNTVRLVKGVLNAIAEGGVPA